MRTLTQVGTRGPVVLWEIEDDSYSSQNRIWIAASLLSDETERVSVLRANRDRTVQSMSELEDKPLHVVIGYDGVITDVWIDY